ncbi:RNA polymerase sigma factor [Streptomyces sp. NPDC050400]|uniref:RNA polymerase sigma factor n=1 Tax=Streptomyces sp. NPDC050400 TaxID=3365610 RepID=UPI00378F99FF
MPRSDGEFDAFVRKDHAALVLHLAVLGFDQQLAQDAAQEAVTMLYLDWGDIDDPRSWVRLVGRRTAIRLHEREARQRRLLAEASRQDSAVPGHDPDQRAQERNEEDAVLAALRSLPEAQRAVMAWHFDGFDAEEIAAFVGKPAATVRSHLRHARNRLRSVRSGNQQEGGAT